MARISVIRVADTVLENIVSLESNNFRLQKRLSMVRFLESCTIIGK